VRHVNRDVLKRISDRTISEMDLRSEINKLEGVTEPPAFWITLVNDRTYPAIHRAMSICQFFKRHFTRPMDIVDLARLLDDPEWITSSTVDVVAHLKGEVPVQWNLGETVLAIRLFSRETEDLPVLYLRLSRPLDAETFVQMVRDSRRQAKEAGISVLEGACSW